MATKPDIELLFRQQFRSQVREGQYRLDFALSGETALNMLDACAAEERKLRQDIIAVKSDAMRRNA